MHHTPETKNDMTILKQNLAIPTTVQEQDQRPVTTISSFCGLVFREGKKKDFLVNHSIVAVTMGVLFM